MFPRDITRGTCLHDVPTLSTMTNQHLITTLSTIINHTCIHHYMYFYSHPLCAIISFLAYASTHTHTHVISKITYKLKAGKQLYLIVPMVVYAKVIDIRKKNFFWAMSSAEENKNLITIKSLNTICVLLQGDVTPLFSLTFQGVNSLSFYVSMRIVYLPL